MYCIYLGIAHVCLVMPSMTLVRSKIDMHIPRKRKGHCDQHEKGMEKFFDQVMQALLRHVDFEGLYNLSIFFSISVI